MNLLLYMYKYIVYIEVYNHGSIYYTWTENAGGAGRFSLVQ